MKMSDHKINIPKSKLDINLKFYFFLKHLVKLKLSNKQSLDLHGALLEAGDFIFCLEAYKQKITATKLDEFENILASVDSSTQDLFFFSLKLYMIKDVLLEEAKLGYIAQQSVLAQYNQLSLSFDKQSLLTPYTMRVNGALLSLIFFEKIAHGENNFISKNSEVFIQSLADLSKKLILQGVEPNQIFMLMFSESVNQSIISDSGSDYESRIFNVLTKIGIPAPSIKKVHDELDSSTEYDFLFELNGKTFGIGAKKTLRERYKQFIKTSLTSPIDVTIQITLGLDLNEEKAKTIRQHGTILFVAEEIYNARPFLQQMDGVFSSNDLTLQTLENLAK
jgi:hypothetical protein